jgi:hypothetical protein
LPAVSITRHVHLIRPTNVERKAHVRDGEWFHEHYSDIKKEVSLVQEQYLRSGQQDAADESAEWLKFCHGNHKNLGGHIIYAVAVLSSDQRSNIGKFLPVNVRRETGDLADAAAYSSYGKILSSSPSAVLKREQRKRKRDRERQPAPVAITSSPLINLAVESPAKKVDLTGIDLKEKFNIALQCLQHGDSKLKAMASSRLMTMISSGWVDTQDEPAEDSDEVSESDEST